MSAAFSEQLTNTGSSLRLRQGTYHILIYHAQAWPMNHTGTNIPSVKTWLHRLVKAPAAKPDGQSSISDMDEVCEYRHTIDLSIQEWVGGEASG